jgi:hypothetical protein
MHIIHFIKLNIYKLKRLNKLNNPLYMSDSG